MLSTLLKGRNPLGSARADKRLGAIAALTPDKAEKLRNEIADCARGDADLRVRRAALEWVDDGHLLEALLDDAEIVEAAATRLAVLGATTDHPAVRSARMRSAASAEAALEAASGVTTPEELAVLFLRCPSAHREALLGAVRSFGERGLSTLERESRNHDKQANRIARDELEHLRGSSRAVEELCTRAEELKAALGRETTGASPGRRHQLARALAECARGVRDQAATLERYGLEIPNTDDWQAAIDTATSVAAAASAAAETEAAAEALAAGSVADSAADSAADAAAAAAAADANATDDETASAGDTAPRGEEITGTHAPSFDVLSAELQTLDERMSAGESLGALKPTHDELSGNWLAQADRAQPDKDQKTLFETVSHRYRELLEADQRLNDIEFKSVDMPSDADDRPDDPDALQALWKQQRDLTRARSHLQRQSNSVRWPDWAPMPQALQSVADTMAGLDRFNERANEHQKALEDELAAAIEKTGANVADGHLKPARTTLGQARKLSRSLPDGIVRRHRKALLAAAARVEELQDWQAFATSPKRQELLDSMQALAEEEPSNAKDQADRIKALRAEWNALGPVSDSGTRSMHTRFNRYAERAFEPCRAHFNEQAELRKRNLSERRHICEQLEEYLDNVDWATADMRAAEQIMRTARDEWRARHPVDRRHAKGLDARFEALQERIFTQLKTVWDANLAAKRAIVEAAENLAAGDASMPDKIHEAKGLQRQWRDVGMTPRGPDQKLWRQFREQCDLIFEARDSGRKQAASDRDSAIARAEAICESMQEAVAAANPATADRATLSRLRAELYAIRLPDRLEKNLHRRFDEIARSYNQLILAGEIEVLCRDLEQLKAWDVEVSQAEAEGRAIEPPTPAFAKRTANGDEPVQALHRLTLEAELLAGIESPPADRQLRLEVQVDALNQSMGRRAAEKEPPELAETWCRLGPKGEASGALRERFFSALLKLARPHDR